MRKDKYQCFQYMKMFNIWWDISSYSFDWYMHIIILYSIKIYYYHFVLTNLNKNIIDESSWNVDINCTVSKMATDQMTNLPRLGD